MPGSRSVRGALVAAVVVATVFAGCSTIMPPISLRTAPAPQEACDAALLAGSLERQPQTGLGIATSDVEITAVEWPFGYSARLDGQAVVLLDAAGRIVAREHDRVEVGGGMGVGPGGIVMWMSCGRVGVVSNEGG